MKDVALTRRKAIRHEVCRLMCKPTNQGSRQLENVYRFNRDDAVIITSVPMRAPNPDA